MLHLSSLALLLASPLLAADLDVSVKSVYFQTIRPRAFVDGRGAVWFNDKAAVHDASGKRVAVRPSEKHELILADKAGRFWFRNHYEPVKSSLVYSVGDTVTDTKLAQPVRTDLGSSFIAIHEDTAGRVFVRTAKAVHVLSPDGRWDDLKLFETDSIGFTVFVEDPTGRTWMSVAQNQPKVQGGSEGTVGAWCFDGTAWKQFAPADGFPFEQVEYVLPFADDWFLVIEHVDDVRNAPKPRSKLWSPSRTAKQIADVKAFADLPTFAVRYLGTDLDGNRYLSRPYAAHDGAKLHEATLVRVSPNGEVTVLDELNKGKKGKAVASDAILKQPQVQSHPLLPILARPGDVPALFPQTGSHNCLGRDTDGRIWFREHYGTGSHCLWPAKEKPGDILRLEPHGLGGTKPGLLSAGGEAWAVSENLDRWDGKTWVADSPFPPFKAAHWWARPAPPPEYYLANFLNQGTTPTADGLLAWRVTSKYEGTFVGQFGRGPGGAAKDPEEPKKLDPKAPFFTYRLALRDGGRWGTPDDPLKVLKDKAKDLVKALKSDRAEPAAVAVAGDGARLWVAFDWKLHVIEANGDTTTVELPRPKKEPAGAAVEREPEFPPLMTASLLPLAENKVLVATPVGARVATFRATKVREIGMTDVAGAASSTQAQGGGGAWGGPRTVPVPFHLLRDKAGAVWGWGRPGEALSKFDGEKFTELKSARSPMAITDDGVLWCYPPVEAKLPPGFKRPVVLVRVCGDSAEKFTWGEDDIAVGFTKPPKGSAVVWPSEHGLLCVEAQAKPGERPVLRKRVYAESMGWSGVGAPFVVTATGEIMFGSHWGRLFE